MVLSELRAFSFTKDVKSIAEITTLTEETFCNMVGKTVRFKANPFGWYYGLCQTCNKTNQSPGSPFQCNCSDNSSTPITKYKIEIEVEHESKTSNFVFWDKECIPYIGMSAHALRQVMKKTNKDHPLIYPEYLDHLLDKDFAFRAKYQPYYRQASIVRLTQDCKACLTITNKDESPKGKVVLFLEDNNVVNTQTNVTHSKTTTSATQNWSPEASISNTPSKWLSPDLVQDLEGPDLLSPKLSATNAAKTKSGRNTKNK
ncbi:unnamed protein product [Vicia faba]|uniref:Replication factor A C-terminal domain-containing protein n=1 Tax=Vicia faba TaxID=3906 RepID=A0AAV0ZQX3_VICFA|nr:unnamed protein product [Vicia faba]